MWGLVGTEGIRGVWDEGIGGLWVSDWGIWGDWGCQGNGRC